MIKTLIFIVNKKRRLMITQKTDLTESQNEYIGPKMKFCFVLIWAHQLFLTWLVLATSEVSLKLQAICLSVTIIIIYLQLVLMQDYFYLKTHQHNSHFRKDVRLIKPLLQKDKRHDK